LDVGASLFAPEESAACVAGALSFTRDHRMASRTRSGLVSPDGEVHFREALKLAPEDDEVHFRWGATLVALHGEANPQIKLRPDPFPAELREARELLNRAIELNPRRSEAYVDYGTTYLFDPGEVGQGIAALEVARSAMPSRMDVVYNLVALYLRSGDRSTAQGLTDHVLARSKDPQWLQRARQSLQYEEAQSGERQQTNLYYDAIDRYNVQDFAGALSLLDQLEVDARNVELTAAVHELRQKSEEALRQQQEAAEFNRQVALYNEAEWDAELGRDDLQSIANGSRLCIFAAFEIVGRAPVAEGAQLVDVGQHQDDRRLAALEARG
jgi:tetratricopeptide (TPR) repeat protein